MNIIDNKLITNNDIFKQILFIVLKDSPNMVSSTTTFLTTAFINSDEIFVHTITGASGCAGACLTPILK